ncbi:hypothetical protein EDB87DRAFT_1576217 [Lactarius vividus]|nr:hypothetical protein EDB87DRAFT_1576217 [Lactarius vividus]
MSQAPASTTTPTSFETIFEDALEAYNKQTKKYIASHPLIVQLKPCGTPSAILDVLRAQVQVFGQSQNPDEKLTAWLVPTVNVLHKFSATLGKVVGLVFPPSNAIFTGIGILLQAITDVHASQEALIDLFGRIEHLFKRLEAYIEIQPTAAMVDIIVKIMVEVLSIFGTITKEIKQGRMKKYLKMLVGWTDIEDSLNRLDRLTQEEVRMAAAEALKINHGINDKVKAVDEKVERIDGRVQAVRTKLEDVDNKLQGVNDEARRIKEKVSAVVEGGKEIRVAIQQVANQVNDINRS